MHDLPTLILQAKSSSECRKQLEQAIEILVYDIGNYTTLEQLLNSGVECQLYCSIVVERRLKLLLKTPNEENCINLLVGFMNNIFSQCTNLGVLNKLSDIYALSILYFYPKHNTNFFEMITNAVENESLIGYLVLREYLFMLNVSTEITSERRMELKNAGKAHMHRIITILLQRYGTGNSDKQLLSIIIEIFTNALPHYKENVHLLNFTCAAGLQTNVTLDFFSNFLTLNARFVENTDKIIDFAMNCDPSFGFDTLSILSNCKIDLKSRKLHDALLWLVEKDYFIIFINFLCKIYKKEKIDNEYTLLFLNKVAYQSHKIYSINQEPDSWLDYDPEEYTLKCIKSKIEDFVRAASAKRPRVVEILQSGILPNRLATLILNLYPNTAVYTIFLQSYQAYILLMQPDIIPLDYSDPESCKLALLAINRFVYPNETMLAIIDKALQLNHPEADDLIVTASIKVSRVSGTNTLFSVVNGFDDISVRRLVIYIKRGFKEALTIVPNFIAKFEETTDFKFLPLIGICLKFKIQTGNSLQIIYNCTKSWPFDKLKDVINSILNYTDEPATQTFMELFLVRMKSEEETGIVGRCFLNVLERKIAGCINSSVLFAEGSGIYFYCNLLIELLSIHDSFLVRRIQHIVTHFNLELNYPLIVYKLLILYNADDIPDAQPDILRFLADIVPKMDDLTVFVQVNKSNVEIQNLKDSLSSNKKKNAILFKEFLKNIKGANFRADAVSIGSQVPKPNKVKFDPVDVSDFFRNKQS